MKFEPAPSFYYLLQAEESGEFVSVEDDGVGCAPPASEARCCGVLQSDMSVAPGSRRGRTTARAGSCPPMGRPRRPSTAQ